MIKDFIIQKQAQLLSKVTKYINNANEICKEAKETKFTKKAPRLIASFCCAMLTALLPTVAFAEESGTSTVDTFIDFVCEWLKKIGAVVMMVGGVMFALGWQREDADGKTRGLQTLMAGGMVAAIGLSPSIFGL